MMIPMHHYLVDREEVAARGQPVRPIYTDRDYNIGTLLAEMLPLLWPEQHEHVGYSCLMGAELCLNIMDRNTGGEISFVVRGSHKDLEDLKRQLKV